jgi:hypothetical protein
VLTQTLRLLSTARTRTTQRRQRAANERDASGSTQTMAQGELGKDWH